jgi:hypothetical protein
MVYVPVRLRAANISVYLKRYHDVAAAGEQAGRLQRDQKFSLLSHGNLGCLCETLRSSGIVDPEEADYGRQAGCTGTPSLR